ncbi:MAG TPA: AroM family protein [Thermomicrobiaceae bacterium]|nr:AroM family protein [Thermomicrobiaceae bacterium]
MTTVGFATIAESPRDDVVPYMRDEMPAGIAVVERGCLDGRAPDEIAALGPEPGEVGIVARLKSGGSTLLSHRKLLPIMQRQVDALTHEDGADLVVILCGADWSDVRSERLVVNPGRLFPATISALAHGRKLGVIKPSAGQIAKERERYAALGIEVVVTAAEPYAGEERLALAAAAAEEIRDAGCDLVWMTCIGMDPPMRQIVAGITGKPVILAHALLARIVTELVASRQPALV